MTLISKIIQFTDSKEPNTSQNPTEILQSNKSQQFCNLDLKTLLLSLSEKSIDDIQSNPATKTSVSDLLQDIVKFNKLNRMKGKKKRNFTKISSDIQEERNKNSFFPESIKEQQSLEKNQERMNELNHVCFKTDADNLLKEIVKQEQIVDEDSVKEANFKNCKEENHLQFSDLSELNSIRRMDDVRPVNFAQLKEFDQVIKNQGNIWDFGQFNFDLE